MSRCNIYAIIAFLIGAILLLISYLAFDQPCFGKDMTHEAGFALIVSVIIWFSFEIFSANEAEELWIKRMEKISKNVFLGVFKRNLPEAFINQATMLVLDHDFVRSTINITYTLTDHTYVSRDGTTQDFVKLNARVKFKMTNVSEAVAKLPIRMGLPNPIIDEMKSSCKVNKIIVKIDDKEDSIDLSKSEEKFCKSIEDDTKYQAVFDVYSIDIPPQREVELIFDYSMAKEEEDTEIFTTAYPTEGIFLTIVDTNPNKRIIKARSIHRCDLDDDTSAAVAGTYNFTLDKYLLPHQGYAVWWKKVPPVPGTERTKKN